MQVFFNIAKKSVSQNQVWPVQVFNHFAKNRYKTSTGLLKVHHFAELVCLHKSTL